MSTVVLPEPAPASTSIGPRPIAGAISHAKESLEQPKELAANAEKTGDFRQKIVARVYAEYQKELHEAGALDFDDLLCETVRLFRESPETLEYYQNRWRYIMVDEYQDTNHVQYMLVALLAQKYKNICVVGDDDQSIYKFRGATIENILYSPRRTRLSSITLNARARPFGRRTATAAK